MSNEEEALRHKVDKLCCTIYHRRGITISGAQGILGGLTDADFIINYLVDKGYVFLNHEKKYEYTYEGLVKHMQQMMKYGIEEGDLPKTPKEEELMMYTRQRSARLSA